MRMDTSASGGSQPAGTDVVVLLAAVLLLAAILVFVGSCGSNDLIFPGNVPATETAVNTVTPTPA
jgi:hypothetical protein